MENLAQTIKELESLLVIIGIEGLSSECHVIDNPNFVDEDVTTVLEISYNTGDYDIINIKR